MANPLESTNFIKFLLEQPAMHDLGESDLMEIYPYINISAFNPGTTVFFEGEMTNDLCLIFEGEVSLVKSHEDRDEEYLIGKLHKGDVIGEMAFLDNSPRSCSVKTDGDLVLIKLLHKGFEEGSLQVRLIYGKISRNLGSILISRLKEANRENIRNRIKQSQKALKQNLCAQLFLKIVTSLILTSGIVALAHFTPKLDFFWVRWVGLIAILIPIYQFIKAYQYPITTFGISSASWTTSFGKGLGWSGFTMLFLGFIFFAKRLIGFSGPSSFLAFPSEYLLLYPAYAFLSEFLLRGILQTTIRTFLSNDPGWISVLYTAIIVAACNLPFGMSSAILIFGLNLCCGFLYLLEENLLTSTLLHISIVMILNYEGYLIYSYLT